MKQVFPVIILFIFGYNATAQNYIGYNKDYIKKEMRSRKKDMKGPFVRQDSATNYLSYVALDGKRVVYYHLIKKPVQLKNGKTSTEEICYKYITVNECKSVSSCPEMDKVINSLNSHFTKAGHMTWHDESKKVPHEWVVIKQDDHFQVYVRELD